MDAISYGKAQSREIECEAADEIERLQRQKYRINMASRVANKNQKKYVVYAILEVSLSAWAEIADKMRAAGYEHAFGDDTEIDMHGIAIKKWESEGDG